MNKHKISKKVLLKRIRSLEMQVTRLEASTHSHPPTQAEMDEFEQQRSAAVRDMLDSLTSTPDSQRHSDEYDPEPDYLVPTRAEAEAEKDD